MKDGVASALERFVFSPEANYVEGKADEDQPKMLDRFLSGLLHPMIHAGHGVEFNAPGMLAEGKLHLGFISLSFVDRVSS